MKQSGKASVLVIVALICLAVVGLIFVLAGSSPKSIANDFMVALAKGDVDRLVSLSYLPDKDEAAVRKDWEFATQVAGPYYRFSWRVGAIGMPDDSNATVEMFLNRGQGDEEKFDLPMVLTNGKWLVDVGEVNRGMFPALPR